MTPIKRCARAGVRGGLELLSAAEHLDASTRVDLRLHVYRHRREHRYSHPDALLSRPERPSWPPSSSDRLSSVAGHRRRLRQPGPWVAAVGSVSCRCSSSLSCPSSSAIRCSRGGARAPAPMCSAVVPRPPGQAHGPSLRSYGATNWRSEQCARVVRFHEGFPRHLRDATATSELVGAAAPLGAMSTDPDASAFVAAVHRPDAACRTSCGARPATGVREYGLGLRRRVRRCLSS